VHLGRVKVINERVLDVAFEQPLQVTRGFSENAFKSDKVFPYKWWVKSLATSAPWRAWW
jgi:hypothetical protein